MRNSVALCLTALPVAHRPWPYETPREPSRVYDLPLKGHKVDLSEPLREARVAAGLAKQTELLAARAKAKEPRSGAEAAHDEEYLTKKEKRIKARAGTSK